MTPDIPENALLYVRPAGPASEVLWRTPDQPADAKSQKLSAAECEQWLARLSGPQKVSFATSLQALEAPCDGLKLASGRELSFRSGPLLMGIVNVTPDSFFDGGRHAVADQGIAHAHRLIDEGADIIDIGGESTRPGAETISVTEELERVMPVIEGLKDCPVPVSIDTRHAEVMDAAVSAGATMINDVSALRSDPDSLDVAARLGCPVVLMHAGGEPKTMQQDPSYDHVLLDVYDFLAARIDTCLQAGIPKSRLVVDPGIGFGKTLSHNMALIDGLGLFLGLGCPVLFGASRKSFLAKLGAGQSAEQRLAGSLAVALRATALGAGILRVHDVAETRKALNVWMHLTDA